MLYGQSYVIALLNIGLGFAWMEIGKDGD